MIKPSGLESQLPDFTIPREKQPSATGRQEAHGFGLGFAAGGQRNGGCYPDAGHGSAAGAGMGAGPEPAMLGNA